MIYLVRHGESVWNLQRRTQGQIRHPRLTERGRAQARQSVAAIAVDLGGRSVSRIVTSDLVRAVETAQVVADALGAPVRADARLREQGLGTLEGLGYDEAVAAGAALDWSDPDLRIGGGESARQLSDRMTAALADLDADDVSVVVSHGDAIRSVLRSRAGFVPGAAAWIEVPNGAVVAIDGDRPARWLAPVEAAGA